MADEIAGPQSPPKATMDIGGLSSNLVSDFGPVLALFGEQVARQFMSESMGWSDNILFAMAPLGIITAIVGAIRVGGPRWLKAIIGRARENRALAEIELMSSTSDEVCELWNGQHVVRLMGAPEIREFIHISPGTSGVEVDERSCGIYTLDGVKGKGFLLEEDSKRFAWLREQARIFRLIFPQSAKSSYAAVKQPHDLESSIPPTPGASSSNMVLRSAPNISLNIYDRVDRWDHHFFAAFGTVLQLGVLAFGYSAAKYPRLQAILGKSNDWACFHIMVGTITVVTGMLLCAYIVENGTYEERYWSKDGAIVHILWLQKGSSVNDQVFYSHAIFAEGQRRLITTSRRNPRRFGSDIARRFELLTVAASFFSLCGFVVQFIGLRGMHWSVSVAQLGATILMTVLRAWVRRGLAKSPYAQQLPPGFEIDWLAMRIAQSQHREVLWRKPDNGTPDPTEERRWIQIPGISLPPRPAAAPEGFWGQHSFEWGIETGKEGRDYAGLQAWRRYQEIQRSSRAQKVVAARKRLGLLTKWPATSSSSIYAVAVATSIEAVMNTPGLLETKENVLVWSLNAIKSQTIFFKLHRQGRGRPWEANVGEIEAALSLWLFSSRDQDNDEHGNRTHGPFGAMQDDDRSSWLLSGKSLGQTIRLLGVSSGLSRRDMRWWMGDGFKDVFEMAVQISGNADQEMDTIALENYRTVGWGGQRLINGTYTVQPAHEIEDHLSSDKGVRSVGPRCLASLTESPSDLLFAQDMFSAFMRAFAQSSWSRRIEGQTTIQSNNRSDVGTKAAWRSLALQNTTLSRMVQSVQRTGLGSIDDVYLSVLPALSSRKLLPDVSVVVDFIREQTRQLEAEEKWEEVAEHHVWAFQTCIAFDPGSRAAVKATAALTELLRSVTVSAHIAEEQQYTTVGNNAKKLKDLQIRVSERLSKSGNPKILAGLAALYKLQRRMEGVERWKPAEVHILGAMDGPDFGNAAIQCSVLKDPPPSEMTQFVGRVDAVDVLGWTALHYAAMGGKLEWISFLLDAGLDWRSKDIAGRTPLHLASDCPGAELDWVLLRDRDRVEINSEARDGSTPLHCAARSGNVHLARLLLGSGADLQACDQLRRTPLHWAAYSGSVGIVDLLIEHGINVRAVDDFGRTALHLAAIRGYEDVVRSMLKAGLDINVQDSSLRTALSMAASTGQSPAVQMLVDIGADIHAKDKFGCTPLHHAAGRGHASAVQVLVDCGANINAEGDQGQTALQNAVFGGHSDVVEVLVNHDTARNLPSMQLHAKYHGTTALHTAALGGYRDLTRLLIEKGVPVDTTNDQGQTALHVAVAAGQDEVVGLLLGKHADVNTKAEGMTALHIAASLGRLSLVRLLLNHHADINATDHTGQTALHRAARKGFDSTVGLLMRRGGNLHARADGKTALYEAVAGGHAMVVKVMAEKGANLSWSDTQNTDLALIAAEKGHYEVLQVLVAGKWARKDMIHLAMNKAVSTGHHKVVQVLMRNITGTIFGESQTADWATLATERGNHAVLDVLLGFMGTGQNSDWDGLKVDVDDKYSEGNTLLHIAASKGHHRAIKVLLEHDADIKIQNERGKNAIHIAAEFGFDRSVRVLAKSRDAVNLVDRMGRTALHGAASGGHPQTVSLLIEKRVDLNRQDRAGRTAFHNAASNGHAKVVELLLEAGADISLQDRTRRTPLHQSAAHGHCSIVEILIGEEVDVNFRDISRKSAIHDAASKGQVDAVELLMEAGADVNLQDITESSPLYNAAGQGHNHVVKALLGRGAQPNILAMNDRTPLHNAASGGHLSVIRTLIDGKADPTLTDRQGRTALHEAASYGHPGVVEQLIGTGMNVDQEDRNECIPLHDAAANGHEHVVEILVNIGANINKKAKDKTPLDLAVAGGHRKVIKVLEIAKADFRGGDAAGRNLLHIAAWKGHLSVVEELVGKGLLVDLRDKEGKTALHLAAAGAHANVVKFLLDSNADANAKCRAGESVLYTAVWDEYARLRMLVSGHGEGANSPYNPECLEVVQFLLSKNADVNAEGGLFGRPLQAASASGWVQMVELLLRNGALINEKGGRHGTALQSAIAHRRSEVVVLLRRSGAIE